MGPGRGAGHQDKPRRQMMGQGKLDGRVAIVTGAAAGMGQAAAVALAAAGADVTLADVADCGETARQVTELGRRSLAVKCDVKLSADVRSMVDQTLETSAGWTVLSTIPGPLVWVTRFCMRLMRMTGTRFWRPTSRVCGCV